jgi:hypothetical protein
MPHLFTPLRCRRCLTRRRLDRPGRNANERSACCAPLVTWLAFNTLIGTLANSTLPALPTLSGHLTPLLERLRPPHQPQTRPRTPGPTAR